MRGKEEMILNEINILKQVSQGHPNIITLHDCKRNFDVLLIFSL